MNIGESIFAISWRLVGSPVRLVHHSFAKGETDLSYCLGRHTLLPRGLFYEKRRCATLSTILDGRDVNLDLPFLEY